jgi:hypothetical protein
MHCTLDTFDETPSRLVSCVISSDRQHLAVGEMWIAIEQSRFSWSYDPPNENAPFIIDSRRFSDREQSCVTNTLSDDSRATLCLAHGRVAGFASVSPHSEFRCVTP